jgi:hypothetical protein
VQHAIRKGDAYGKRCKAILSESWREEDPVQHRQRVERETRAFVSGGGATASASGGGGAAFVSPAFLLDSWAPYRSPIRTFADQCARFPLPDYGMEVYIPVFTSAEQSIGTDRERNRGRNGPGDGLRRRRSENDQRAVAFESPVG